MGGFFLPAFLDRVDFLEAEKLYFELDGSFPNHEADPLKPENLHDVSKLVQEHSLDFGVAYDGDADRCMFVDEKGEPISSDLVTALISTAFLAKEAGAAILFDLRSSKIVPEWITEHGGKPVRGRVGHSFMKRLLTANNAPFGGELSGHYYFRDCFNTDSGLMAMIQVINIWQEAQQSGPVTLSELVAPLRKYSATGEINFRVADVPSVQKSIEEHYIALGAKTDHLDGLTVDLGEWWFNLRSSNTEPLLRLNLEAANPAERDKHYEEVKTLIGGEIQKGH
jgi:phosphomannomutase